VRLSAGLYVPRGRGTAAQARAVRRRAGPSSPERPAEGWGGRQNACPDKQHGGAEMRPSRPIRRNNSFSALGDAATSPQSRVGREPREGRDGGSRPVARW
jgi:hypothetical protein